MADLQAAKVRVRAMTRDLDAARAGREEEALSVHLADEYLWRGMHPWDTLHGASAVAAEFWAPLRRALGPMQRRPDMFLAGENVLDGRQSVWVCEMGHLMGLWDADFLGIPATRKIAFLRYVEFHRIEADRIAETASYVDLLDLMGQAGVQVLPAQTGAAILTPGPRTHDGLLYDPQDPEAGRITADLITAMVDDLRANKVASPGDHMARFWTPDMCWFGPSGIGASAFFDGYRRGHTQPFEDGLDYVKHDEHVARIGEGMFGGFFGYPSLTLRSTGGFMGLPASDRPAEMRIVDMYRREGDKLAENWIFIDMLHFLKMQGLDVLARLKDYPRT